jgi:ADP-heptose:LPS heptosyltransferase
LIECLTKDFPKGEILVTGVGSDAALAESIASGTAAVQRLTRTIPEMAELIASASLLVGLDSAAVHIAALCGTRSITIFSGTTDPARWHALGNSKILTHAVPCSPCWSGACNVPGHPCMTQIVPELVIREIRQSIRSDGA